MGCSQYMLDSTLFLLNQNQTDHAKVNVTFHIKYKKSSQESRFSIVSIVISVSIVTSPYDCSFRVNLSLSCQEMLFEELINGLSETNLNITVKSCYKTSRIVGLCFLHFMHLLWHIFGHHKKSYKS